MQTQTWLIWSPGFKLLCSNLSEVSGKIPPVSKARLGRAMVLTWLNLSFGKIPLIIHGAHAGERERENSVQTREMGDKDLAAIQRDSGGLDWVGWGTGCRIDRLQRFGR